MIVLGFDTATPATAVALRLADGTTLQARDDPSTGERPGHATRLLPLADELLAQASLAWGELQRIGVGVGPGTFTGLRVGIATARGLAQSLAVDLVGISTLQALAVPALRGGGGWEGGVLAVVDARRGEAFIGAYPTALGGPLEAPCALAPEDFADGLPALADMAHGPWLAVGDGAIRFRSQLEELGVQVPADPSPLHRPSAAAICALALDASPGAPETVLPDYVRRPDAELALANLPR